MVTWTQSQRERLALEESLLLEEFPHFSFYDRDKGGLTTIWGQHTTSATKMYQMCLWIKNGFPFEMPGLYITSPCPLYGYGGKSVQSYGASPAMDVYSSDWNNYVKICHCKSDHWSASNTIISVLMKGLLWLEAFEVHCKTGKYVEEYTLHFK